jgi:hypothetical protein
VLPATPALASAPVVSARSAVMLTTAALMAPRPPHLLPPALAPPRFA